MTAATLTRDQIEGMDDVSTFANQVTEAHLDALIEAKEAAVAEHERPFDVEILSGDEVVAIDKGVLGLTKLHAAQKTFARTLGNYGFRVL